MGAKITAIEYVFPNRKITNDDLVKQFPDYDFSRFEEKVGIKNRYWVDNDETALSLAKSACNKLFKRIDKKSIDYILYCTQSPEYFLPTTACILQNELGLRNNIGALDFNLGCSGYTYGLSLAKGLLNDTNVKNILLVTSETYSKYIHPMDKSNLAIFGDAATATLISFCEDDNFGDFLYGTDGSGFDKLIVKNGAGKHKFYAEEELKQYGNDNMFTDNNLYMNGPDVFNFTLSVIPDFTLQLLEKNKIALENIDQVIFHQANKFMLNQLRKKIKINQDKFYIDIEDGGNTVSNTLPIALKKYSNSKKTNNIENIILVGFGVGLSWSGGLVKISEKL